MLLDIPSGDDAGSVGCLVLTLLQPEDEGFLAVIRDRQLLEELSSTEPTSCASSPDNAMSSALEIVDESITLVDTRRGGSESKYCGRTTHFTDFGVFLGGGGTLSCFSKCLCLLSTHPSIDGGGGCSTTGDDTLPLWLWLLHVLSVAFFFTCALILIILMLRSYTIQKLTMGNEGARISKLRRSRSSFVKRTKTRQHQLPEGFQRYQQSRAESQLQSQSGRTRSTGISISTSIGEDTHSAARYIFSAPRHP